MNVVYASSDLYSELAGISIVSLFENNQNEDAITVYIIDSGIQEDNKNKLYAVARQYGRKVVLLPGKDIESLAGTRINVNGHSTVKSLSTYYRLLLPSIIPETVDRIIYLDCDTIINDSLHELMELDMRGAFAMGADDCRGKLYRDEIDIPQDSIYINNGFLLIDLKAWRENNVEREFIDFIHAHAGVVTYDDEGVLNGVLGRRGKTGLLPLRYNTQVVFYSLCYDEIERYRHAVWAYTKEEVEDAVKNPAVIHFTSFFMAGTRVWNAEDNHPMRGRYLYYKSLSPWKDCPDWPDNRSAKKKISTRIYNAIPKPLLLRIFAVLHSNLYPRYRIALSKKAQKAARKAKEG